MKYFARKLSTNIKLYEKLKSDFTYHSSAIEGSTITEKDNTKIVNAAYSINSKVITSELLNYKHDEVYENRNLGIVFDKLLSSLDASLSKETICE
ncbi:hypothetical protein FACS1894166_06230 [Bacilli bacterium]|nr:hypothetical protein FACS1894166_06230 [Bacilli bacterium]